MGRTTAAALSMAALVFTAARPAPARATPTLGVQAGWWSVEAEWRSGAGPYAAIGAPWAFYLLDAVFTSGLDTVIPFSGKVGWEFPVGDGLALRAGGRLTGDVWRGDPCGTGCTETGGRAFGFLEGGVRWQAGRFVAGADVPVIGFEHSFEHGGNRMPIAPLFAQAWLGAAWDL